MRVKRMRTFMVGKSRPNNVLISTFIRIIFCLQKQKPDVSKKGNVLGGQNYKRFSYWHPTPINLKHAKVLPNPTFAQSY